jgi:hypothetical protein
MFFKTIEELNLYVDKLKSVGPHIIIDWTKIWSRRLFNFILKIQQSFSFFIIW